MYSLNKIIKTISFIALTLGCFGLSPEARAVCQEGCLGNFNTVLGEDSLLNNTGFNNTATGSFALAFNTTGNENTATGLSALLNNTTGANNTANGVFALFSNSTGAGNTAIGSAALAGHLGSNHTGNHNTATGSHALSNNIKGNFNTATGASALAFNTTGNNNTAIGHNALVSNRTGNLNIALGVSAGANLTHGDRNIDIGNVGVAGESKTIRIGTVGTHEGTFIAGIRDVTTGNGDAIPVLIDSAGQLGTMSSSRRFKKEIKPMEQTSEAILGLKPVTFHYKSDSRGTSQFGLIAEEVAQVNPDLVARDDEGKPYTVRYEAVNAMLLNEFLKEHRKVEEQAEINQRQEETIARLGAALKEQAAQIQKVSAQLQATKPAPRIVAISD